MQGQWRLGDLDGNTGVSLAELNTVITNYFGDNSTLMLTNFYKFGTLMNVELTNQLVPTFTVLVSTNQTAWQPLTNRAVPGFRFLDPAANTAPQRFYRFAWP
jgi:hypothetical protein